MISYIDDEKEKYEKKKINQRKRNLRGREIYLMIIATQAEKSAKKARK